MHGATAEHVRRWDALKSTYPEAAIAFHEGWYYGALRDCDELLRAPGLGDLLDALSDREN